MKRVAKSIVLMDTIAKINDPQCELLLLRTCVGICKLYFSMCTCSPWVFEMAQCSLDAALCSALEHIATASGPRFGDWQWRLATLPFEFRGLTFIPKVSSFSITKLCSACSKVFTQ
nr:reverse transcriptase domain-containing protein [Tanacetum cinerariifolium]